MVFSRKFTWEYWPERFRLGKAGDGEDRGKGATSDLKMIRVF
jgi:hypothetical protein